MAVVQSASALLRSQFRLVHGLVSASADAPSSQATACHAQSVLSEDLIVNGVLAAGAPLALSTWHGRTGLSELPPFATPIDWRTWAQRVRFKRADFHSYAQAVYAATDAYLALEHPESTASLLSALLLTISMRRGQIACLQSGHAT